MQQDTEPDVDVDVDVDVEVKNVALCSWWQRHNKSFSLWYLMLDHTVQIDTLLECIDMPRSSSSAPAQSPKATDLIVPELVAETLNGNQGRGLIIFLTSRLVSTDLCYTEDIAMLEELRKKGRLPNFSNAAFQDFKLAFVDRADPTQTIQALGSVSDERTRKVLKGVERQIEIGNFIHGEVFVALNLRRRMIATLLEGLTQAHQMAMKTPVEKPSPTYTALLKAEIEMRKGEPIYYAPQTQTQIQTKSSNPGELSSSQPL